MHLVPELSYDVWNADDMLCSSAVIDGLRIRDVCVATSRIYAVER